MKKNEGLELHILGWLSGACAAIRVNKQYDYA